MSLGYANNGMSTSKSQDIPSSDIELLVLTSDAPSFQPPLHEQVPSLNPMSETNLEDRRANSTAMVDGIEPPTPAYSPPSNDALPAPSFHVDPVEYARIHGQSDIPLSSMSREDDRTSNTHAESPPAYKPDPLPVYSFLSQHNSEEPTTWPMICFSLGCGTFFIIK